MTHLPKIINKAELARSMGIEPQNLNNKLKGTNRQIFTEDDRNALIRVLKSAITDVKAIDI